MNALKKFGQAYARTNSIVRIVIGLAVGILLGLLVAHFSDNSFWAGFGSLLDLLGTIFVGTLKAAAPVVVFILIISSLSTAGAGIGGRFKTVIILYMSSTLVASVVAVIYSFAFPITMELRDAATSENGTVSGVGQVWSNLLTNMVCNPIAAIADANYIGILFWAVIFGLALKKVASDHTKAMIGDFAKMISQAISWIIMLAPFGVMGLVASSISEYGMDIFKVYGQLVLELVASMLTVFLITDPAIAALFLKRNPYPLSFTALRESGITAFFTRSSAANIPVNMATCRKLGLDEDFYSVSIPLGATINMDGAAAVITIMSLSMAHTLGIQVSIGTAIMLSFISTLAACGASGVAGGSLLLIPMACSLFGIDNDLAMKAVEVGFVISVIQDSVETALNSSGDVVFTSVAEYYERRKKGEDMKFLGEFAKHKD